MRPSRLHSAMDLQWPTVAVLGVALGVAAVMLDWRLLVPLGLGLPLLAYAVLGETSRARSADLVRADHTGSRGPWLEREAVVALGWAVLFFRIEFIASDGGDPVSMALRFLISAVAHGLPLLIVLAALVRGWPGRVPRHAQLFGAYALFAAASVTWSVMPSLSLTRAIQFSIFAALTAYSAARAWAEPRFVDRLLLWTLRYLTWGAVLLGLWGMSLGGLGWERFAWSGQHPNSAAAVLLVPCVGLLCHPDRSRITWPVPWWGAIALLAPLAYATGSRTAMAAALVAVVAAWFVATTQDSGVGATGTGVGLILIAAGSTVAAEQVSAVVHRNQTTDAVTGLNGRMELWQWVLNNPLGSEVWGVGVAAARGDMPVSWNATTLHSTWLEVLQSLGVIGLAILGAVVLTTLVLVVARQSVQAGWLLAFAIMISLAETGFAAPGYSLVLLCLAVVITAGRPSDRPGPTESTHSDQRLSPAVA